VLKIVETIGRSRLRPQPRWRISQRSPDCLAGEEGVAALSPRIALPLSAVRSGTQWKILLPLPTVRFSVKGLWQPELSFFCEVTTSKFTAKLIIVCCDRLLLAHSANFIKLTFVVVKIFWWGCCAPPRLLRLGATAPSALQLRHWNCQRIC